MSNQIKISTIGLIILFVFSCACGSGGGKEETPSNFYNELEPKSYKLYPDNYLTNGYVENYSLQGEMEDGTEVNANLKISMVGQTDQSEKPQFFSEQSIDIFFSDGRSKHRRIINKTTLQKVINTRIYPEEDDNKDNHNKELVIPTRSISGSYGVLFDTKDADENTEITTWRLDQIEVDEVRLLIQTEIRNVDRKLLYFENISFKINENGERMNVSVFIEYPDENIVLRLK